MNKWWQINIHQLCESNQLMLPERWDFWTLWIAQRRWKPLCLGCWNGRFGCFFWVGRCCLQGFATPFVASIIFFLFKENEKWNIYIYIYWVMFFLGTVDVVCVCWCFIRYTNGSCSVFMLVIIWFVTGIGYRCVWSKTKGTWSGIGDITVE